MNSFEIKDEDADKTRIPDSRKPNTGKNQFLYTLYSLYSFLCMGCYEKCHEFNYKIETDIVRLSLSVYVMTSHQYVWLF